MTRRARLLLVALVLGLGLLAAGAGAWIVLRPTVPAMIVPGAVAVQIQSRGFGEQQITYRSPGKPYGWYFMLVNQLAAAGWVMPIERRDGLQNHAEYYWRISSLWLVYIKEEIALQGDQNMAHITIRREIIVPWQRLLGR